VTGQTPMYEYQEVAFRNCRCFLHSILAIFDCFFINLVSKCSFQSHFSPDYSGLLFITVMFVLLWVIRIFKEILAVLLSFTIARSNSLNYRHFKRVEKTVQLGTLRRTQLVSREPGRLGLSQCFNVIYPRRIDALYAFLRLQGPSIIKVHTSKISMAISRDQNAIYVLYILFD
jgi:hypothetical protein